MTLLRRRLHRTGALAAALSFTALSSQVSFAQSVGKAGTMYGGVPVSAGTFPPLTPRLIEAVNRQQAPANTHVVISPRALTPDDMRDARKVAGMMMATPQGCGLGAGALVVGAGFVEGTLSHEPVLTVFLNPTGNHAGVSVGGTSGGWPKITSPPLNWYVGFLIPGGRVVAVRADGTDVLGPNLFCTSGYSSDLPPLATHGRGDVRSTTSPEISATTGGASTKIG